MHDPWIKVYFFDPWHDLYLVTQIPMEEVLKFLTECKHCGFMQCRFFKYLHTLHEAMTGETGGGGPGGTFPSGPH